MNNLRLLTALLAAILLHGSGCVQARAGLTVSIEDLFALAETNSVQLRPSFAAEQEADRRIAVARSGRLPDINASLSLSFIGDGFTTRRDFSDRMKAPIPHLGNGLGIDVSQPIYTGGAVTAGIKMAEVESTAARYATELQRDNIRFRLAGFYLDIYKYGNLSYWYVGVGVNYNISSLYKSSKTLARSRAATQQASDRLDAALESVSLGVRADYVHYLEAYEELRTQEKSVELAVSNYDATSTRYNADMALITDMLDAANARLDAEQRLVNARIDIIYYY